MAKNQTHKVDADDVVDDGPARADMGALADTLVDRGRAVLDQFPIVADSARGVLAGEHLTDRSTDVIAAMGVNAPRPPLVAAGSTCDRRPLTGPARAIARARMREGRTTMGIISWIVLGAIAGFLANMVMGGREGVIGTIILGIIGAVVGGYLAQAVLHKGDVTGVNIESIVIAVVGAIIVLFVWRALTRNRAS